MIMKDSDYSIIKFFNHCMVSLPEEWVVEFFKNGAGLFRNSFRAIPTTIIFGDIIGFTKYTSTIKTETDKKKSLGRLSEYFDNCVRLVEGNDGFGFLNKTMGDGFMALFPDRSDSNKKYFFPPILNEEGFTDERHSFRAVMVAVKILSNEIYGKSTFNTRFGIHLSTSVNKSTSKQNISYAAIGNVKPELTVIGRSVNIASRLESENKKYGTRILFSEYVFNEFFKDEDRHVLKLNKKDEESHKKILEEMFLNEVIESEEESKLDSKLELKFNGKSLPEVILKDSEDVEKKILWIPLRIGRQSIRGEEVQGPISTFTFIPFEFHRKDAEQKDFINDHLLLTIIATLLSKESPNERVKAFQFIDELSSISKSTNGENTPFWKQMMANIAKQQLKILNTLFQELI